MKKVKQVAGIITMTSLLATPAIALETKLSGFINLRGISDNFSATNNYIGTFADGAATESAIDQRLRLKLDAIVNEYLGFTYYTEVDMQWGDEQYSNDGRNDGGGIGGDTTNLESKNLYMDIKIPDSNSAFRLGLQGMADNYDYSFFAADMAGVKYTGNLGPADITAGWFKLGEGDFDVTDDVNLWLLQAGFNPSENLELGTDYYYYQNSGSTDYATFFGTADIADVVGAGTWTANREEMDLHYLGGHGKYKMEQTTLTSWVNVNIGTVEQINNDLAAPAATADLDVQGYSGKLNVNHKTGSFEFNLGGTYFSGDDDITDGDATFIVNPLATESFAFANDGFMIFTPDVEWNSVGQYGFAMVDAAWAGYGLTSVVLNGKYTPESMDNLTIFSGVGYFASLEDKLAINDPRTDRSGTQLGTEVFLRINYKFANNLDIALAGAYAFLGDFYDNNGGGTAANSVASDIDNPWEVYLKTTLVF